MQALAATKPWVRLCSICGFIGCGFMFLGALGIAGVSTFAPTAGTGAPPLMGMSIAYVLLGILYLFPSLRLWKYGSAILRLMSSGSILDLEAAIEQQRGFWKFVGIMVIIGIVIWVIAMVGVVGFSVFSASKLR